MVSGKQISIYYCRVYFSSHLVKEPLPVYIKKLSILEDFFFFTGYSDSPSLGLSHYHCYCVSPFYFHFLVFIYGSHIFTQSLTSLVFYERLFIYLVFINYLSITISIIFYHIFILFFTVTISAPYLPTYTLITICSNWGAACYLNYFIFSFIYL